MEADLKVLMLDTSRYTLLVDTIYAPLMQWLCFSHLQYRFRVVYPNEFSSSEFNNFTKLCTTIFPLEISNLLSNVTYSSIMPPDVSSK